ncbi:MAG: SAV_6107 family HEPN domain-containing protein [Actinomycetales bacterium]
MTTPTMEIPVMEAPARVNGSAFDTARELMDSARRSITEATVASTSSARFAAAHLAALRAATAVLAVRAQQVQRRGVRSVWSLLPEVAEEFTEWAAFFAATAGKRAQAQVGMAVVSMREADDLVRDAEQFLERVSASLGLAHQSVLIES